MPSRSEQQRKFIFAKRNQYGSKDKAPEKWKWVFDKEWETIEEMIYKKIFKENYKMKIYKPLFFESELSIRIQKAKQLVNSPDWTKLSYKSYAQIISFFKSNITGIFNGAEIDDNELYHTIYDYVEKNNDDIYFNLIDRDKIIIINNEVGVFTFTINK